MLIDKSRHKNNQKNIYFYVACQESTQRIDYATAKIIQQHNHLALYPHFVYIITNNTLCIIAI